MTCYAATDPSEKSSLSWFLLVDTLGSVPQTSHKTTRSTPYPDVTARLWNSAGAERTADRQRQLGAQTTRGVELEPARSSLRRNVKHACMCLD